MNGVYIGSLFGNSIAYLDGDMIYLVDGK